MSASAMLLLLKMSLKCASKIRENLRGGKYICMYFREMH